MFKPIFSDQKLSIARPSCHVGDLAQGRSQWLWHELRRAGLGEKKMKQKKTDWKKQYPWVKIG